MMTTIPTSLLFLSIITFALNGHVVFATNQVTSYLSFDYEHATISEYSCQYDWMVRVQSEETIGSLPSRTKSVLLPGWGQIDQEEYLKGSIFLTVALSSFGFALYHNHEANQFFC